MNDLRKAAEMALEALEEGIDNMWSIRREGSIQALRQALAQKQEPAAWMIQYKDKHEFVWSKPEFLNDKVLGIEPLYTSPPKREWVGLTDQDVRQAYCSVGDKEWSISGMTDAGFFAELIEAKLKEKNT